MKTEKRYLVPGDYMADPAVHVFDGKLYIYPSHDWESGIAEITDHGFVISTGDIRWAGRQLWDCDFAFKDG